MAKRKGHLNISAALILTAVLGFKVRFSPGAALLRHRSHRQGLLFVRRSNRAATGTTGDGGKSPQENNNRFHHGRSRGEPLQTRFRSRVKLRGCLVRRLKMTAIKPAPPMIKAPAGVFGVFCSVRATFHLQKITHLPLDGMEERSRSLNEAVSFGGAGVGPRSQM